VRDSGGCGSGGCRGANGPASRAKDRVSVGSRAALALHPLRALADLIPDGYDPVKLSLLVTGQIPPGTALLVANTMSGAEPLTLDTATRVRWHPLNGPLSIALIDATKLAAVKAAKSIDDRNSNLAVARSGVSCTTPFDGVRTLPSSSPAREVRFVFAVRASDGSCTATQTRVDHLASDGTLVQTFPAEAPSATNVPERADPECFR
jgi:hypothetical protein